MEGGPCAGLHVLVRRVPGVLVALGMGAVACWVLLPDWLRRRATHHDGSWKSMPESCCPHHGAPPPSLAQEEDSPLRSLALPQPHSGGAEAMAAAAAALVGVGYPGALCSSGTQGPVSLSLSQGQRTRTDALVACQDVRGLGVLFCGLLHGAGSEALAVSTHTRWLLADLLPQLWSQRVGMTWAALQGDARSLAPGGLHLPWHWRQAHREAFLHAQELLEEEYKGDHATDSTVSAATALYAHGTLALAAVGGCVCLLGFEGGPGSERCIRVASQGGDPFLSGSPALPEIHLVSLVDTEEGEAHLPAVAVLTTVRVLQLLRKETIIHLALSPPYGRNPAAAITRAAEAAAALFQGIACETSAVVINLRQLQQKTQKIPR